MNHQKSRDMEQVLSLGLPSQEGVPEFTPWLWFLSHPWD